MSERKPIEVPEHQTVTLVNVQAGFDPKTKSFVIGFQEIETVEIDHIYNVGGAKIGKDTFGKAFLANDNLFNPVATCIDLAENRATAIEAVKTYLKDKVFVDLNNTVCHFESMLTAIESDNFKLIDPKTGKVQE